MDELESFARQYVRQLDQSDDRSPLLVSQQDDAEQLDRAVAAVSVSHEDEQPETAPVDAGEGESGFQPIAIADPDEGPGQGLPDLEVTEDDHAVASDSSEILGGSGDPGPEPEVTPLHQVDEVWIDEDLSLRNSSGDDLPDSLIDDDGQAQPPRGEAESPQTVDLQDPPRDSQSEDLGIDPTTPPSDPGGPAEVPEVQVSTGNHDDHESLPDISASESAVDFHDSEPAPSGSAEGSDLAELPAANDPPAEEVIQDQPLEHVAEDDSGPAARVSRMFEDRADLEVSVQGGFRDGSIEVWPQSIAGQAAEVQRFNPVINDVPQAAEIPGFRDFGREETSLATSDGIVSALPFMAMLSNRKRDQ